MFVRLDDEVSVACERNERLRLDQRDLAIDVVPIGVGPAPRGVPVSRDSDTGHDLC